FGQRVEVEAPQRVVEAVEADERERAHGRDVEGAAERRAHTDEAVEITVVVLRRVEAARRGDGERTVVDERGGGEETRVARQRVEKGFQRRARLPRRRDAVHPRGGGACAAAADIR